MDQAQIPEVLQRAHEICSIAVENPLKEKFVHKKMTFNFLTITNEEQYQMFS